MLVTNSSRSAVRISLSDIASVEPMPVEVPNNFGPAGVNQFPIATEAVHLDMLNSYWAVAIRRSVDDPRISNWRHCRCRSFSTAHRIWWR